MAAAAAVAGPSSPSKKDKKHKSSKKHKASKHAEDADLEAPAVAATTAANGSNDEVLESAFETMYPVLNLAIPPVWTPNPFAAFSDLMDTLVMRYVPQLSGVLITHRPLRFLSDTAKFYADNASASAPVQFECIVWRPKIGQKLEGVITLSSPSHVSLLLYGTFNASIPASHLAKDLWEFVIDAEADLHVHAMGADRGLGHWRSKVDGSRLGGEDGKLSFTVISMTVANHILSLHGSLLDDPFSVPAPTMDASYLAKSLSDANVLGFAAGKKGRDRKGDAADGDEAARDSPKPQNRRVRWEDESDDDEAPTPAPVSTSKGDGEDGDETGSGRGSDDDDGDDDDDDDDDDAAPPPPPPAAVVASKKEEKKSKGSKRKSRKSLDEAEGDEAVVDHDGSAKSRDKKKRKKDKEKSSA